MLSTFVTPTNKSCLSFFRPPFVCLICMCGLCAGLTNENSVESCLPSRFSSPKFRLFFERGDFAVPLPNWDCPAESAPALPNPGISEPRPDSVKTDS